VDAARHAAREARDRAGRRSGCRRVRRCRRPHASGTRGGHRRRRRTPAGAAAANARSGAQRASARGRASQTIEVRRAEQHDPHRGRAGVELPSRRSRSSVSIDIACASSHTAGRACRRRGARRSRRAAGPPPRRAGPRRALGPSASDSMKTAWSDHGSRRRCGPPRVRRPACARGGGTARSRRAPARR
jgi:hypothetical protein